MLDTDGMTSVCDYTDDRRDVEITVFPKDCPRRVRIDEDLLREYGRYRGLELDYFQKHAISAVDQGFSVLVGAPTGAGKTLIADYLIGKLHSLGKRVLYTAPIKTLSMQKFREFKALLGSDAVGVLTGDVVINQDATVLIMTTEVLRNMILEDRELLSSVSHVIFDEIHYISDEERGHVWEQCLILLPKQIQILGLSATVPNLSVFAEWVSVVRESPVVAIKHKHRPVPLEHRVFETSIGIATLKELKRQIERYEHSGLGPSREARYARTYYYELVSKLDSSYLPCLYFVFSRRKCEDYASSSSARIDYLSNSEKEEVANALLEAEAVVTGSEHLEILQRCLVRGIAFHHAGLLPPLKRLVEELYERKLVKLLFATETFAVGINYPVRTVCFESPMKYDGKEFRKLKGHEYFQMAGRAGRRGIDTKGTVITLVDCYFHGLDDIPSFSEDSIEDLQGNFSLSMNTVLNLATQYSDEEILDIFEKGFDSFRFRGERALLESAIGRLRAEERHLAGKVCPHYKTEACFRQYRKNVEKLKQRRQELEELQALVPASRRQADRVRVRAHSLKASIAALEERVEGIVPVACGSRAHKCNKLYRAHKSVQKQLSEMLQQAVALGSPETRFEDFQNRRRLLEDKNYIASGELQARGSIARHIHIQELLVTELLADGILNDKSAPELAALAASIDYEPRRMESTPKRPFFDDYRIYDVVERVREWEARYLGYEETVYNESLARAAFAWAKGENFATVRAMTDSDEGTIVLVLRRSIDLLRQMAKAVSGYRALTDRLHETISLIDRDIVEVFV